MPSVHRGGGDEEIVQSIDWHLFDFDGTFS